MKQGILCSTVKNDKYICDYFEIPFEHRKEILEHAAALRKDDMSDQEYWLDVKAFLFGASQGFKRLGEMTNHEYLELMADVNAINAYLGQPPAIQEEIKALLALINTPLTADELNLTLNTLQSALYD